MLRYVLISLSGGILFGVLDGLINANPTARKLYAAFQPISKKSVNALAGFAIDIIYGFALAGLFILLYDSLPGAAGWVKGISFGIIAWYLRVLMSVASQWMMFNVPLTALAYTLLTGLAEMLLLGSLFRATLKPF